MSSTFLLAQSAVPVLVTQAVDDAVRTLLPGNVHPLARPQFDQGEAPADLPMSRMLLVLKRSPEQEAALRRLIEDQQNKNSPAYHRWLTPQEFGARFGPADSDVAAVTNWLKASGFQVSPASNGRTIIEFSGTAGLVKQAFRTAIHKYVAYGEQHWANASDPSIPTALEPVVAGVSSLHNFRKKAQNSFVGTYSEKEKRLTSPAPNFTFSNGQYTDYALVPYDFATIYHVLPLWDANPAPINGMGQTIAIVGRTDIDPTDATAFWNLFGLDGTHAPQPTLIRTYNGVYPGINDDEAEADIDTQWSGAVAPGATINLVISESTETTDGVDLSALYIVDNNLAPVMSESYGLCEAALGDSGVQFYGSLWEQAAAQGISVFVSTGDNGSAGCDNPGLPAKYGLHVNGLASTPFNAAVGGTDFNEYKKWSTYWNSNNDPVTQESAKGYIPETTWDDSCTNPLAITLGYGSTSEQACNNPRMINAGGVNSIGGSGGKSTHWLKPTWQTGTPADNARDLPDISLFASNGFLGSFYVICQKDATYGYCDLNNFAGYGGTSVASPAFAGIMALVNQKTGSPQGVPGLILYKLATKQPTAFHDVPSGTTIAMPCLTGSPNCVTNTSGHTYGVLSGYNTATGYDLATGLGSVDAANLVNNWDKVTFTPSTTTLSLSGGNPVSVTHGTAVSVAIGVTPASPTPTGDVALLVAPGTPGNPGIDRFTLSSGAVNGATSLLPGGSYSVIAHFGGNGTYGGSYSNPVSVTVSKENSTVILKGVIPKGSTTPVTSIPFDAQYFIRADVGNSQGTVCNPPPFGEVACPSGGVIFTDNGTRYNFNTFPLNSEGYTETWVGAIGGLTGGQHTLGAQYDGDNNYNAGSGSVVVTVTRAATDTTPVTAQGAITQPVTLTTDIEDPTAYFGLTTTPTGTVTFYSNGTAIPGTPVYSMGSNGIILFTTATLTTTFPAPGTYTLTANYSGDQNYQPSASAASQVTLQYPVPTVTASPATQNILAGTSATVSVLVDTTNKRQPPTGTVSLLDGPPPVGYTFAGPTTCTQSTDNNGNYGCQATLTFPFPGGGTSFFFWAQYSGDANYPASVSGPYWVYYMDFSLTPSPSQVAVTQGQSQQLTISTSGQNGFTGTVGNFSCSGLPAGTSCTFNPTTVTGGSGSTTLTITTTPLGQMRPMRRATSQSPRLKWIATAMLPLLCLIGIPAWGRRRRALPVLMMIVLLALVPSCGGGGGGGTPPNPVPSIASLSPTQQAAGSQSQPLTINGSGFINGSAATYNGVAHATRFTSTTRLSISLSASDLATQGSFPVVVANPAPGGGASSPMNFTVTTGTPTGTFTVTVTATSGTPPNQLQNSTTFTLNVVGQ